MSTRLRLLLVIPHLGGGGAEQVTALLAEHLDSERFEIHLGLLTPDRPGARRPPDWVAVHRIHRINPTGAPRVRQGAWALLRLIRALEPDLVFSNMVHLNHLVLLLKPLLPRRTRVAVRQNTTASAGPQSRLRRLAFHLLYARADLVICQSLAMADDLGAHCGLSRNRIAVLANPVDVIGIESRVAAIGPSETGRNGPFWRQSPTLLAVGRLSQEKGIDLLLRALAAVSIQVPGAKLLVIGTGEEEERLQALAQQLDLKESVVFLGHQDHPSDFYSGSTLFVQPSRWEGIPNALLEAAAGGLPIVATPSSRGVVELLQGQPHTWVAGEISSPALAAAMLTALARIESLPECRGPKCVPPRFKHGFLAPFVLKTAIENYERVLLEVAQEARS